MLSTDCLNHILTVENTLDDGWLTHDKLAQTVDAYVANHKPQFSEPSEAATVSSALTKNGPYQQQEAQLSLRDRATRACQLKSCKLLRCTNVDDLHLNSPETDE